MTSLILDARRRCAESRHVEGGFGSMIQALSLFLGLIVVIISLTTFATGMAEAPAYLQTLADRCGAEMRVIDALGGGVELAGAQHGEKFSSRSITDATRLSPGIVHPLIQ